MFAFKTTAFSVLVLSLASLAAATPLSHSPRGLAKRSVNQQALYCSDPQFNGVCVVNTWKQSYPCMNVDKPNVGTASSFKILDPTITCILYDTASCTGGAYTLVAGTQGIQDLKTVGFDNRLASFACEAAH